MTNLLKLNFWLEWFDKILESKTNWGSWSDMVAVMLPDILCEIKFGNILSMRVFEWLVILVGCKMYGVK